MRDSHNATGVCAAIEAIPASEWKELPWDLGEGHYAETVDAFRLIVIRRPYQRHLVRHAGRRILRICGGAERLDLFNRVRRRLFEAYATP